MNKIVTLQHIRQLIYKSTAYEQRRRKQPAKMVARQGRQRGYGFADEAWK